MKRLTIESLAGETMSAVAFVQDYVEFHFDEKIVRALTNASLVLDGSSWTFPEPGARDAFCKLIGRIAEQVYVDEGKRIQILFSGGAALLIPLDTSKRIGPEAAHFVPGENQPIDVW